MSDQSDSAPRLVVGVGASAGGLEAFRQFLDALPADTGMAFVLVQHLSPSHESRLAELLATATGMTVQDAEHGARVEPDSVYVIPPGTSLSVQGGRIQLSDPELHRGVRLPVDHLFNSLAEEYGPCSVGIVLSGAGSDGSTGVRAIRAAGGLVIAQDPETLAQSGMPRSAIDTGVVDLVLPIEDMPSALERFDSLPYRPRHGPGDDDDASTAERERVARLRTLTEMDIGRLADVLDKALGIDLRVYKRATIERRVLRRMTLSGFEDSEAYISHVLAAPDEQRQLMRDMLISVTEFFRDPEAYRELRSQVLDPLVKGSADGDTLRIWVPGCATGEEAYSIGIEALDAMAAHEKQLSLQIYATDIDRDALTFGRAGVYPLSIADRVPERRLNGYFESIDGTGYRVRSALRDIVSFAAHDLTRDPPFSKMDLVSCRNVLIYLTPAAQKHVLKILHFALNPQGCLFLSTSESTGAQPDLFSTVSKTHRIYRKLGNSRPVGLAHSPTRNLVVSDRGTGRVATAPARAAGQMSGVDLARRAVLEALAPPTLVVSANGTVVFSHGELGPYMRIPEGEHPRFELGSMLRPEIATRVRGAVYKCRRTGESVVVFTSPDTGGVRVEARPAPTLGDQTVILTFEEVQDEEWAAGPEPGGGAQDAVIDQLERELQATRDDLRSTVEELEVSNEELRSSSEESMSMNEELQAANEELEATSEELRSLNEELTTVNAQLREKVEELEDAHDDLSNFFASTRIATVFLDRELRIKRFTPVAREVLGIDDADLGRFVSDIARELLQDDLAGEATKMLGDLSPRSKELQTRDGHWFSRQILPYRTESQRIEGAVVTFVDITESRAATERVALREQQQRVVARLGLRALGTTDIQVFMEEVVREMRRTLRADFSKILELQPGEDRLLLRAGVGWLEGRVGSATEPVGSGSPGGYALRAREPVLTEDMRTERRFSVPPLFEEHEITSGIACIVGDDEYRYGVIGAYTKERRRFTPEDVDFVQAVANVVGSAIGRQQARLRLALELAVAHELAEPDGLEETLDALLQAIATEVGHFAVAELWWPAGEGIARRAFHVEPTTKRRGAERHLAKESFSHGEGVVGQVFAEGRAVWVTDLTDPEHFARAEGASALGLVSGFGFPVGSGGRTLGVITLFSSERLFADDTYLHSLETIGRSIGDFVARSEADEAARELAAITSSSHDAIFAYRLDGTVDRWLAGAEGLYGYSAEEVVGGSIELIVPEELRGELASVSDRIRRGEIVEPFETRRVRKDGTSVEVSVRSSPIADRAGRVMGISSTDRDIGHMKDSERRLVEADRQKDEFIAMLGHELRNPLGVIRTAVELLKLRGGEPAAVERTQSIIERQSEHMAKLLDGLLDVSRIISGKIRLERDVVDLVDVCRAVSADFMEQHAGDSIEIRTDLPPEPLWVDGDHVRLTQVIANLLSNAVKYTGENGVVTISVHGEDGTGVVRVMDTGIGIEAELLPHVFDFFRQSDQNLDRSEGGLGLGLALVKSLVELHHGHVEARSEGLGKGAEFVVALPLTTKARRETSPVAVSEGTWNVLVIEDNEDSGQMLKEVLEAAGHQARVATLGRQGLEMAREDLPDVVLCDLGLPGGMTGFDVAERMRSDPETQCVPLVALSGYGRPEDKERSARAGFEAHLTKPVDLAAVMRVLSEIRGGS